jgi:hypothetical protein
MNKKKISKLLTITILVISNNNISSNNSNKNKITADLHLNKIKINSKYKNIKKFKF